jgi:predicted nucleic acid-binding protein
MELSYIIPIEVAHNLYKIPKIDKEYIERLLFKWITQDNIKIIHTDQLMLLDNLQLLKEFRMKGIGGRDCLILASMNQYKIKKIITHDKNILALNNYHRLDPVFDPPLDLPIGCELDLDIFKKRMKELSSDIEQ